MLFRSQQNIEQALRLAINSLGNKKLITTNEIRENNSDVFECTLARRFIMVYRCGYKINSFPRGNGQLIYTISFEEFDKKGKPKKGKTAIKPFALSEYSLIILIVFLRNILN